MAGGGYSNDDDGPGTISQINVTPLVDIVLVLLVIFMVTARLIAERGIAVNNPKTVSGGPVSGSLALIIKRKSDTTYDMYVNGRKVSSLDQARALVLAAHKKTPDLKAIISADKSVPHGKVMSAIDMVEQAGITKFALASAPKSPESSQSSD